MSDPVTKAYKAINGLDDLNYILDRRNDGAGRVALKRFFFFDNSDNAYREVAGRDVREIDQDKLDGEKKLARLRRFEQVWKKYGKECVSHKKDPKVQKIGLKLMELMKDIGDIDELKAIVSVNDLDRTAYRALDSAVALLVKEAETEIKTLKQINFNQSTAVYKKEFKSIETKMNSIFKKILDQTFSDKEFDEFIVLLNDYESNLSEYDRFLTKNAEYLTKSVRAKHLAFLENRNQFLADKRKVRDEFLKIQDAKQKFKLAERALVTVTHELSEKLKERTKWDPPNGYAHNSVEEIKTHIRQIERALEAHKEIDEGNFGNKEQIRADRRDLEHKLLTLKELISEGRLENIARLDKEIFRLQQERDAIFRSKNSLENQYVRLNTARQMARKS